MEMSAQTLYCQINVSFEPKRRLNLEHIEEFLRAQVLKPKIKKQYLMWPRSRHYISDIIELKSC